MSSHWQSYVVPACAACLLHLVVALVFMGGWFQAAKQSKMIEPNKVVKASLVTLKKPRVQKRQTIVKPKARPKKMPEKALLKKPKADQSLTKTKPVEALSNEQLLDELLAAEDAELEQLAIAEQQRIEQQQKDAAEVAQYAATMRALITSNWSRPPSARNDMEVVLEIQLVPTGDVVNVRVQKSSGNAALDRSAVAAVEKVGRFSLLQGMPTRMFEANFRRTELRFKPSDLRM